MCTLWIEEESHEIISLMEYLGDVQLLICTYQCGILLLFSLLLLFIYIPLS
jgi:hypothetical protein